MTGRGRPLRFLALLLSGWITARAVLLWPPAVAIADAVVAPVRSGPPIVASAAIPLTRSAVTRVSLQLPGRRSGVVMQIRDRTAERRLAQMSSAPSGLMNERVAQPEVQLTPARGAPVGSPPRSGLSRWSASAWLIARGNGAATLAPGGMLGGSQAGLRVAWRPMPDTPVALFGRLSRPLRTRGAEAAIGIEAQPIASIPVRAAIEQRFALEPGAAEGTALSLIGGVSDVRLPAGFLLDGYGQAGVIGWRRRAAFADGAVSIVRPVASLGKTDLLIGAGMWGAAQPGLSRLDIGPRGELRFPVARQRVRLGMEWRGRIAGDARPGSGPALTLGTDF